MDESNGQVSFEYLMIFAISLIILIVFTLPLVEYTISNTMDVSDSIKVKSDMEMISSAIKQVYGQGQGARQSVNVMADRPFKINFKNSYAYTNLKLNDNTDKSIKVSYKSTLKSGSLSLKKGVNTCVVEWPVGSDMMEIYLEN